MAWLLWPARLVLAPTAELGTRPPLPSPFLLPRQNSSLSAGTCRPNYGGRGECLRGWSGAFGLAVARFVTERQILFGLWDCHSPPCAKTLHCAMLGVGGGIAASLPSSDVDLRVCRDGSLQGPLLPPSKSVHVPGMYAANTDPQFLEMFFHYCLCWYCLEEEGQLWYWPGQLGLKHLQGWWKGRGT